MRCKGNCSYCEWGELCAFKGDPYMAKQMYEQSDIQYHELDIFRKE